MSDRRPKRDTARSEDVADLFRILRAMSCDPNISEADFRIAFRISQNRNALTGWAEAGDALLMDELPRTDRQKLRRFRKRMIEAGWIKLVQGGRGRGTLYFFLEANVPEIQARLDKSRDQRHAKLAVAKIERESGLKAAALGVKFHPETEFSIDPITGEISPLNRPIMGVKSPSGKGGGFTPVLPHSTTYDSSCRQQDMTPEAHPSSSTVTCRHCEALATVEVRLASNAPMTPVCSECADDFFFTESRPLNPLRG